MKIRIFQLRLFLWIILLASCKKYEFPDSDLILNRRNLTNTLTGNWELKKLFVNGYDSTKYITDSFPGPKTLHFGFGNYSYNGANSDLSSELKFNTKRIWNCELKLGNNNFGLTTLGALFYGGLGIENPKNFIERLGPNRQSVNYFGGFFIRKLTMQSLVLMDNDQVDSTGMVITNLFIFERR